MTRLEKRAVCGLIMGVIWAIALFGGFVMLGGVSAFREDEVLRGITLAIGFVGSIAYLILYISYRKSGLVDERDRLIMIRASEFQLASLFLTVGAWSVALALIYAEKGLVSIVYLYLIIMAMIMVSMLAEAIGILFWSRRTEYLTKD